MSYLDEVKLKKSSKTKLAIKANKFSEFDRDIYVKAIKKSYIISFMHMLDSTVKAADSGLILIEAEKVLHKFVLMCAVLDDGEQIGDFQNDDNLNSLSGVNWKARKILINKSLEVNKIDVKLIKPLLDMLSGVEESDLTNLAELADEEEESK